MSDEKRPAKGAQRPVVYLKHPVSAEQKAKVLAAGKRIIDVRFKPADAKAAEPELEPELEPEVEVELTPAEKRAATIAAKKASN